MKWLLPFFVALIHIVLVVLFLVLDDRNIGVVAEMASLLVIGAMTLLAGTWKASRSDSRIAIFLSSWFPVAVMGSAVAPINAILRFQHAEPQVGIYLVLLSIISLVMVPLSWRGMRE